MAKNKEDQVTDAGSVELEENELDNVTGGAGSQFLKLGDIDGESLNEAERTGLGLEGSAELETSKGIYGTKGNDGLKSR